MNIHLVFQVRFYIPKVAFQNIANLVNAVIVRFFCFEILAWPEAVFDMVLQTDLIFSLFNRFWVKQEVARTQREDPF